MSTPDSGAPFKLPPDAVLPPPDSGPAGVGSPAGALSPPADMTPSGSPLIVDTAVLDPVVTAVGLNEAKLLEELEREDVGSRVAPKWWSKVRPWVNVG